MQRLEQVNLKHVLQTVCVLEGVVLRSFGPDGGQVLFTRDTGQLLLSRSGKRILTALHLDHPLARMVVECAWKHSEVTGDGSKTFILLLAALLRGIQALSCQGVSSHAAMTQARHTADELLAFGLEELGEIIHAGVDPHTVVLSWETGGQCRDEEDRPHSDAATATSTDTDVQGLLTAFFSTRLGRTHARLMSRLTHDLISPWRRAADPPSVALHFLEKNFGALHTPVCGLPAGSSRLVEGQVIHRDFATPQQEQQQQQPIQAVALFGCSLHPSFRSEGVVLKVGGLGPVRVSGTEGDTEGGLLKYSAWAERSLEGAISTLQGLGITLLLCAGKQTEMALARAQRGGIRVVECVDEEELSLFAELSGTRPATDCRRIGRENIALLTFCKPIVLGAHRYVHVAFAVPKVQGGVQPHSLVLCGAGEGQAQQCGRAVRDALRTLLTMWEPWQRSAEEHYDGRASPHPHEQTDTGRRTGEQGDGSGASSRRGVPNSRCVLPAGGAFEFLLHRALLLPLQQQRQSQACSSVSQPPTRGGGGGGETGCPALCQLLADALLSVPRHIYSHRPRHFLQAQRLSCMGNGSGSTWLCSGLHRDGDDGSDGNVSAAAGEQSRGRDTGLESVFCKYQLVLAVLQCLCRVLHADAVLHTALRAKASPQDRGGHDEDEDEKDNDEQ